MKYSQAVARTLRTAALSGVSAVMIGAFGAHGLKAHLDAGMLAAYQTGVAYQFYHTFGLLFIGLCLHCIGASKWLSRAAILMVCGVILFSGSLYLMAVTGFRWLGVITPVGGLCFIVAWLCVWCAFSDSHKTLKDET